CVSKMDCTPNLALDLIEQLLAGDGGGFKSKFGTIAMPKGVLEMPKAQSVPVKPLLPAQPKPSTPAEPDEHPAKNSDEPPKLRVTLDLPAPKGAAPSLPTLGGERQEVATPKKNAPAHLKTPTRPTFVSPQEPKPVAEKPAPEPAKTEAATNGASSNGASSNGAPTGADFRLEVRQEFLQRAPKIQAELRDRISGLIKSKSTTDQLDLLRDLGVCVSSLSGLSGITGFSRISHLSGALDALIKDLLKKPSQMTASVLRTVAHASDCMNLLFQNLSAIPEDIPQSMLILAVDDEPISRRTISVALSKANLRSVGIQDSRVALTILQENPFDLIFLDAEMPDLNGFELCAELRKTTTNKTTPVIFVTSLTKFEIRAQSSLAGGNDLIAKPFLMMELAVKALTYLLKPAARVEAKVKSAPVVVGA
ncbi:MAG TPA: response regulator, partial [Verrucomicrobiae bacterium]